MMSCVASLGLALAGPFGYELLLNRRLRCRDDLERHFGIPSWYSLGHPQHAKLSEGGTALARASAIRPREPFMNSPFRGARAIRTLGTGLVMQALLSGANFAVGLILIRRTNDLQYSYYVLATNALLLLTRSRQLHSTVHCEQSRHPGRGGPP